LHRKERLEQELCPGWDGSAHWEISENFYFRKSLGRTNHRTGLCKKCQKARNKENRHRLKKEAINYKGGKCRRCGYKKYFGALDFHHLDPGKKIWKLSQLLKTFRYFDDKIKEELDKCDLLCRRCHFLVNEKPENKLTNAGKKYRKMKKYCVEYKGGSCIVCSFDEFQSGLSFHHPDPSKKEFTFSKIGVGSIEKVKHEIDKCILICECCHCELHAGLISIDMLTQHE